MSLTRIPSVRTPEVALRRAALVETAGNRRLPESVRRKAEQELSDLDRTTFIVEGPCLLCGEWGELFRVNASRLAEYSDAPVGVCGDCS